MKGLLTDEIVHRRLAYSRYLLDLGKRQAEQPEPLGFVALLLLHDAIEMVLLLGATHLKLKTSHELLGYWEVFNNARPSIVLENKGALMRLNKARADFKHHGNSPSKSDLREYVVIAQGFVTDSVAAIFELDFNTISLCDLVEYELSRKHLKLAESQLENNPVVALEDIAFAFEVYLRYFRWKHSSYGRDIFGNRPQLYEHHHTYDGTRTDQAPAYMRKAIDGIYDEIDVIRLGIDYIDYAKYKLCVPSVTAFADGTYRISGWRTDVPTGDSARFAHNFVIEQILRLQERSFETKLAHGRLALASHAEQEEPLSPPRADRVIKPEMNSLEEDDG